ncbi:MAG: lamin tail domain-containing protein [Rudaea sp.]
MTVLIRRFAAAVALTFLFSASIAHAAANVKITEYLYSGADGEFVEFTNVGDAPQDMTGWSFDDNSQTAGSVSLSAFGTLQPGESAILTEATAANFRAAWNLCATQKVIGENSDNLGRDDEINLYDNTNALIDRLTYGDDVAFPGTIRANAFSGIVSSAGLGANDIHDWTLSALNDAEHSYTSTHGDIGSPGKSSLITTGHGACLGPVMRITEYMYDSTGDGEFVELTNVGDGPQDMTGWSFDDSTRTAGSLSLSAFGTVQPGESVIISDVTAAAFRSNWTLCDGLKVIGGNTQNLGREDEINIYDSASNLIDRLTYGDQTFSPGSIRTQNASGWVSSAGLGANLIADWTKSTVGDSEASFTSIHGAIASPGKSTRASYSYDACVGSPNAPTTVVNQSLTSTFLNLDTNGHGAASGVISDPTDPAATTGIGFTIGSPTADVSTLTVTATSSNALVVPAPNLVLSGTGANRQLTITPIGVGYSSIVVHVFDANNNEGIYTIDFAASAASPTPATSRFFTGTSDTSTGIALDATTMLVGDDENQTLRIYSRDNSGLPLGGFDFTANLALTDLDNGVPREVDIEASARLGNRVFWAGSHSNSDAGVTRPDRRRVFATDVSGIGADTVLTYQGRYDFLLDDMVAWDHANGHGLGVDALGFTASTASGAPTKQADGFNIEGMTIAPDGTSAYMAFRAPLLPTSARTMGLIVPVLNIDQLVTGNGTTGSRAQGSATFGAPIFLDLAGRGIREIVRNDAGQYLLIAGPPGDDTGIAPLDFRLFTWTGNPSDKPIELDTNLTSLQVGGSWESIIGFPDTVGEATPVQLLADNGDTNWYADGIAAKDLVEKRYAKFRGDRIEINVPLASDVLFRDNFDQR